jgi:hypothetical protein
MLLPLGGCYTYGQMVRDQPVPAQDIEVTLNDRGRLALENNVGSDVLTVTGAVESVSDSGFVLQVQRVTDINRNIAHWANEPVTFRTEWVREMRERRFSAARTVILVGSTAGAVALAAATPLVGRILGTNNGPNGNDGPPVSH